MASVHKIPISPASATVIALLAGACVPSATCEIKTANDLRQITNDSECSVIRIVDSDLTNLDELQATDLHSVQLTIDGNPLLEEVSALETIPLGAAEFGENPRLRHVSIGEVERLETSSSDADDIAFVVPKASLVGWYPPAGRASRPNLHARGRDEYSLMNLVVYTAGDEMNLSVDGLMWTVSASLIEVEADIAWMLPQPAPQSVDLHLIESAMPYAEEVWTSFQESGFSGTFRVCVSSTGDGASGPAESCETWDETHQAAQ